MDPLERLRTIRFRDPALLGLSTPEERDALLRRVLGSLDGSPGLEGAEAQYAAALAILIELQIQVLMDNPETLTVYGELAVTQGLSVKLAQLGSEQRRAQRRAAPAAETGWASVPTRVTW